MKPKRATRGAPAARKAPRTTGLVGPLGGAWNSAAVSCESGQLWYLAADGAEVILMGSGSGIERESFKKGSGNERLWLLTWKGVFRSLD